MIAPASGVARIGRALALASALTVLSGAAHVAAGGAAPGAVATVLLGVVVTAAATQVVRRRLRLPSLIAVLAVGQVVLHYVLEFTAVAAAGCPSPSGSSATAQGLHAGHGGAAGPTGDVGVCADSGMAMAGPVGAAGWWMLAAHAVATLLFAVLLARGEHAVWTLAAVWARIRPLAVPRPLAPAWAPRLLPVTADEPRPAGRDVFLRVSPRRGPPSAAPRPALLVRPA